MALASSPALAAPILASRQDPNTTAPGLVRPYRGALVVQPQPSQRSWSTQTPGPSQTSEPSSYDLPTYHRRADPNSNSSDNQDGSNVGRSLKYRFFGEDDPTDSDSEDSISSVPDDEMGGRVSPISPLSSALVMLTDPSSVRRPTNPVRLYLRLLSHLPLS
jgi:hypothetical protein